MAFDFDAHEIKNFEFDDDDDNLTIRESEVSDLGFLNEEDEYDAINDETFGGCVSALDNLEDFVYQTAQINLKDNLCGAIKPPDPSQIPLPQVNSIFLDYPSQSSYNTDKIWDNSSMNGSRTLNTPTGDKPSLSMANLVGAFTVEEIEQKALLENNKISPIVPTSLNEIMAEELKKNQDLVFQKQSLQEASKYQNILPWHRAPLVPLNQLLPGGLPLMGQANIFGNNAFPKSMQAFTAPPPPIDPSRIPLNANHSLMGHQNVPGAWMAAKNNRTISECESINTPLSQQHNQSHYNSNASINTTTSSKRHMRQKGMPSTRTLADFAFDPYAGFMSKKEREWLIKIQLIQCTVTGDPVDDDFYYTMWKKRNTLEKAPFKMSKLRPKYYSFSDTYPSVYTPPSFSGTLGKMTHSTANFPRQVIDLSAENLDDDDASVSGKNLQKKLRATLMYIENASLILLECEDLKRKLVFMRDKSQEGVTELEQRLAQQTNVLLSSLSTRDRLPTLLLIQKGRTLLFQTLAGVFSQNDAAHVLNLLMETLPKYATKIAEDSITEIVKNISTFFYLLSREQFIELLNTSFVVDTKLVNTSKFVLQLLIAILICSAKYKISFLEISQSFLSKWLTEQIDLTESLIDFQKLNIEEFCLLDDLSLSKKWLAVEMAKDNNRANLLVLAIEKLF